MGGNVTACEYVSGERNGRGSLLTEEGTWEKERDSLENGFN